MLVPSLGQPLVHWSAVAGCPIETFPGLAIPEEAAKPSDEWHWDALVGHCQQESLPPHGIIGFTKVKQHHHRPLERFRVKAVTDALD